MQAVANTASGLSSPSPTPTQKEFLDYDAYGRHRLIDHKFKDQQLTAHGLPPGIFTIFVEGARFLQIHDWGVHMLKRVKRGTRPEAGARNAERYSAWT